MMERPWLTEPSREEFKHAGFPCIIQRGPAGAWCGYVAVTPEHVMHGKGYSSEYDDEGNYVGPGPVEALDVHGGITYANHCAEDAGICHKAEPGEPDNVWWLGFDCAHGGDITPKHDDPESESNLRMRERHPDMQWGNFPWKKNSVYRDIDYVRRETESLAEQLRELA